MRAGSRFTLSTGRERTLCRACSLLVAVSLGTSLIVPRAASAQPGAEPPGAAPPATEGSPPVLPLTLPPPPAFEAPPPPPAPPDLRAPRPGTFPVLLEAEGPPMELRTPPDHPVQPLYGQPAYGPEYLCTTPCTLYLPRGGYTLNAEAAGRPLVRLDLDVRPPGQRVLVRSTSALRLVGGSTLLLFGGMFLLGGLVVATLSGRGDTPEAPQQRAAGLAFGAGLSTVGFAGLLGGGFLLRGVGWGIKQVTPLPPSELARSAP
ncbi:MAG: hypothetical protein U1A78_24820 [Polyangia bacterium]